VATLHEKFTVLQAIGSVLMLGGSFITQHNAVRPKRAATPLGAAPDPGAIQAGPKPVFQPHVVSGYAFGFGAAMCYGSSPVMAREAFLHAPGASTAASGFLAYTAATLFFSLILLKPGSWSDIRRMRRENLPWFLASAVLVAVSQAFVYASLAVAPLMVVTPVLQLSLVFRLFLSEVINRDYEVMNVAVLVGAFTAVTGSMLVSLDSELLTSLPGLPASLAAFLRYHLAGA
jgi:drug/metabolite transporter (DMT)-like permease